MNRRSLLLWSGSALLLAWILLMSLYSYLSEGCRSAGGRWDWKRWSCRPVPAIELRRDLNRS